MGPTDRKPGDHPDQPEGAPPEAAAHSNHTGADEPEETTPRTRRRTPSPEKWQASGHTDTEKKKRETQTKGAGGAETKGAENETGDGDHHKARTRQGRELNTETPPRPGRPQKIEEGGGNPPTATPTQPLATGSPTGDCGLRAERAQEDTPPPPGIAWCRKNPNRNTRTTNPAKYCGAQPKPIPKHPHRRPQPGMTGLPRNPTPNRRTTNPSREWRGNAKNRTQTHTPRTPARIGWGNRETQTQTQAPHKSRKPGVHSRGTEAARAMHVAWPKQDPETGGKAAS